MKRTLVALMLLAGPAFAGDRLVGMTVSVERQLTSCAIKAVCIGDDDSSAVLRIFQKLSDRNFYDSGMVMVRRPHGPILLVTTGTAVASGEIFEGRILNMNPGRTVSYYIESIDGGATQRWNYDTTSCAAIPQQDLRGAAIYVDQATGSSAGPGTLAAPYKTINQALTAMSSSGQSGAYTGILVAPGEYHERLDLNLGSDGLPRFIAGTIPGMDQAIICGENEEVRTGNYAVGSPIVWTKTNFPPMLNHVVDDSIYVTPFPATGGPGDSLGLVVLGSREQLHHKTSLLAMQADSTQVLGSGSSVNTGELSGWFWQHDSLYVKRRNGTSPASDTLHVGYRNNLIKVTKRNWRISRLTFRYAGGQFDNAVGNPEPSTWTNRANPGGEGSGVSAGIGGDGGGLTVDSCYFYGLNAPAVWVQQGGGGSHGPLSTYTCDTITVANCDIDGLIGGFAYAAGKSRVEESACQIVLNAFAARVYRNTLQNSFNGIQTSGGGTTNSDTTGGSQDEIYGNTCLQMPDDAIEVDGSHNINTLVMNNYCRSTNSGISVTPALTGPLFVIYNVFARSTGFGVKISGNSYAFTRFWHNTITSPVSDHAAIDASSGNVARNLWFENNILGGAGTAVSYLRGPTDSTLSTAGTYNLNWNVMDSTTASNAVIATWHNSGRSFVFIQNSFSPVWEANGTQHSNAFVDSSRFDFRLSPTYLGIGRGRRIPGVNSGFNGHIYTGTTPNVGRVSQ